MLFVASLVSMIGAYVLFKCKKKLMGFIASVLCVALLCLYAVNFLSETRNITLSDETLDKIASINWSDDDVIRSLGFEYQGDAEYVLYETVDGVQYSIVYTADDHIPKDAVKYKNISYLAEEGGIGILDINRLWIEEVPVYRRYFFYFDGGIEIWIREDSYEGEEVIVDKIVDNIFDEASKKNVKD